MTTRVVFSVFRTEDPVKRSQCDAPDYCPTSVYKPQDCQGVPDKRTKASDH